MAEFAVRMLMAVLGTWVAYDVMRGLVWPYLADWARTLAVPAAAAVILALPWPLAREALAVAGAVALIRGLTTRAPSPHDLPQMIVPQGRARLPKGLL